MKKRDRAVCVQRMSGKEMKHGDINKFSIGSPALTLQSFGTMCLVLLYYNILPYRRANLILRGNADSQALIKR